MKAQWLERRSGSLPWSLTSIQLSPFYRKINDHTQTVTRENLSPSKIDAIKRHSFGIKQMCHVFLSHKIKELHAINFYLQFQLDKTI